jgi:hypothetical protein
MQLDEQALRKPTFLGGVPVTLADGQDWMIPVPDIRMIRDRQTEDGVGFSYGFNGQDDLEFTRLFRTWQKENGYASVVAELAMYDYVLGLNYALDDDAIRQILNFRAGKAEDPRRGEILAVLTGQASPKAPTGGSEFL